jgi:Cupin-like domain
MSRKMSRWIHIEPGTFDPWRVQAVRHSLMEHPLLQLDKIAELGKRREAEGKVRSHSDQATAATPFNEAPKLHPNPKLAPLTLDQIENAKAWMSLLDIQADPVYRQLVDDVLDDVRPVVEAQDHRMGYRAGWIFVTSPNAVTPFHMDNEHNFIMQVMGRKRLYVWDPFDREAVSHEGLEKFHTLHSRDLVRFSEGLRSRARVFDLEPGMGGYMPSTSPHMVENGDNPSVTVSFTYYTDSTRRRELLYKANHKIRSLGIDPSPIGTSAARDALVHAGMRTFVESKNVLKRILGRQVVSPKQQYAESVYT